MFNFCQSLTFWQTPVFPGLSTFFPAYGLFATEYSLDAAPHYHVPGWRICDRPEVTEHFEERILAKTKPFRHVVRFETKT